MPRRRSRHWKKVCSHCVLNSLTARARGREGYKRGTRIIMMMIHYDFFKK
jgi:hypothetical protein